METEDSTTTIDINLRPIHCELNPLTRTDGSAMLAQGKTCVLASMHGPCEVKAQHLKIDRSYVECCYRPKAGQPTAMERLLEGLIRATCESSIITRLHPRSLISVQIQEMQNNGALEACCINASCLALLIGGVAMKFTFAALQCIVDRNGQLLLDPTREQEWYAQARFLIVYDSLDKNIVSIHTQGKFTRAQFNDAELMCRAGSEKIFQFYRKMLHKFHKKSLPVYPEDDEYIETVEPKEETIVDKGQEIALK